MSGFEGVCLVKRKAVVLSSIFKGAGVYYICRH